MHVVAGGIRVLKVLDRERVDIHARRARAAALVKFAALAGALGYVVAEAASPLFGSRAR